MSEKEGRQEDLAAGQKEDQKEDLTGILANHLEDLAAGQEEDLEDHAGSRQKCMMLCAINAAKTAQCHSNRQAASQYTAVIALEKMTILLKKQVLGQMKDQTALQKTLQKSIKSLIRSCRH